MISSVGKELLSNVVDKNELNKQRQEIQRSESNGSSSLTESFEKLNFPSNHHLALPQTALPAKLSSSTSSLFRRFPLQKQKIGHRRVDEHGQVTFKNIETSQICESLQLGIRCAVSRKGPERDVLMKDFEDIEITDFPAKGTSGSPAHRFDDFKFKTYAPNAFRYFRELFGIPTEDFLLSVGHKQLRELSNPGASGSVFYKTMDDRFIIKTVQQKESHFLRKLLPKYFMNLHQNPDTLLPKFYGLYCYICGVHRVRVVVMNNLLPSKIRVDLKFDLKGSSYKRKASKAERNKNCPTLKDLDFVNYHPKGIYLEQATYDSLIKTIKRDCTVLESFNIMDYSFLIGIHVFDYKNQNEDSGTSTLSKEDNEKKDDDNNESVKSAEFKSLDSKNEDKSEDKCDGKVVNKQEESESGSYKTSSETYQQVSVNQVRIEISEDQVDGGLNINNLHLNINKTVGNEEETSFQQQQQQGSFSSSQLNTLNPFPTLKPNNSFSSVSMLDQQLFLNSSEAFGSPSGLCTYLPADVISGRTSDGKNLLLFCGIIDILQSYELNKRLEHSFKSIITDGKKISVTRPDYYARRFEDFLSNQVFKKDRTPAMDKLEISPSSNLNFIQRKINTPLLNPNFNYNLKGLADSQLFNHSLLSGSSGTNTISFYNQSIYSFKSSIRSAPPINNKYFNEQIQSDFKNAYLINNFNKALQDELTYRRNNLTLNSSITKKRLLSRHGYLESLESGAFDSRSIHEDTVSVASYKTREQVNRLSEQVEDEPAENDKVNK